MFEVSRKIIDRAKNGDIRAFEEIYMTYSGMVFNTALRFLNNRDDAEDITQEVFVRLYEKLNGFKYKSSLKTYIYRMAVNMAINRYRQKKRSNRNLALKTAIVRDSDAFKMRQVEAKNIIEYALSFLPEDQRICIILRELEGLSYEEIAQVLNIKLNTVRSRLARARTSLASALKSVKELKG